jgi:hypothetical protein
MVGPSWIGRDVTLLGFGELFPLFFAHRRSDAAILGKLRHVESRKQLILPMLYLVRPESTIASLGRKELRFCLTRLVEFYCCSRRVCGHPIPECTA